MLILIDCDGVLANFSQMVLDVMKNDFGIELHYPGYKIDCFELPNVKPLQETIWNHICDTPRLISNLETYDYANELIYKLRELGQVICLTSLSKGKYYASERIEWLVNKLLFDRKDIFIGFRKEYVYGDVFIDDKPSKLKPWFQKWPKNLPILWESPNWFIDSREDNYHTNKFFSTGSVDDLLYYIRDFYGK
jgi:5'(3')-deoxyribonucleotidase